MWTEAPSFKALKIKQQYCKTISSIPRFRLKDSDNSYIGADSFSTCYKADSSVSDQLQSLDISPTDLKVKCSELVDTARDRKASSMLLSH